MRAGRQLSNATDETLRVNLVQPSFHPWIPSETPGGTIGALMISYTIVGVPYDNQSRMGPKTLS